MGDRGIPKSYRYMHGFGSHTYSFINSENKRFWVKFTFKTQQGTQKADCSALIVRFTCVGDRALRICL
jgi:catalase